MGKIQSEIRKDYVLDKYAIITPGRAKRPTDIGRNPKGPGICPFCSENIIKNKIISAIPEKNRSTVTAIQNAFPAVEINNKKAFGIQEVIIESSEHEKQLSDLSIGQIVDVLLMYSRRSREIARNKKINYILCFKNHGIGAGASLAHSHSQVFASRLTPPALIEETEAAKNYKIKNNRCIYCDVIKKEEKGPRKILSDKYVIAFAPYASTYHYEAWIFPKRHVDNISLLSEQEIESLAKILKKILTKLKELNLSYNFYLHNVISNPDQHFYIKIQPRENVWGGVELGSGLVINSLSPEEAAKFYRKN